MEHSTAHFTKTRLKKKHRITNQGSVPEKVFSENI